MKEKRQIRNLIKRFVLLPVILLLEVFVLTGCKKSGTKIVFTTGFEEDVVFKIEDIKCTKPEVMVYLVNTENIYDEVFGEKIWQVPFNDGTVESQYKESILARLAQIKAMNLYAEKTGVELSINDKNGVKAAAAEYYNGLTPAELDLLGVDLDTIERMYTEYAIANKVYENVTEPVNPEISDDEARTVTIRSILIKTYGIDNNGNRIEYGPDLKDDARRRAYELSARIKAGEEFEILAADYNEDEKTLYSFARGVMPMAIEEAAFNLAEGDVSDVIETEFGFHIIKVLSNFDEEQTDQNKQNIVKLRKQQTFTDTYDEYIASLTSSINMDLWESISYERRDGVSTTDFFDIYDSHFKDE